MNFRGIEPLNPRALHPSQIRDYGWSTGRFLIEVFEILIYCWLNLA
jgi:hypothetical protein